MTIGNIFWQSILNRFSGYKTMAEKVFSQLEEKDFHFQPNEESNSIAVIMQHISGNMVSRWTNFLQEDGEKDWRNRDEEFGIHPTRLRDLMEKWEKGWKCMMDTLGSLQEEDLLRTVYIRSEPHSVLDAINRQLTHNAYHIGQIVYLGKMIRNTQWKSLSIPRGQSGRFNKWMQSGKQGMPG